MAGSFTKGLIGGLASGFSDQWEKQDEIKRKEKRQQMDDWLRVAENPSMPDDQRQRAWDQMQGLIGPGGGKGKKTGQPNPIMDRVKGLVFGQHPGQKAGAAQGGFSENLPNGRPAPGTPGGGMTFDDNARDTGSGTPLGTLHRQLPQQAPQQAAPQQTAPAAPAPAGPANPLDRQIAQKQAMLQSIPPGNVFARQTAQKELDRLEAEKNRLEATDWEDQRKTDRGNASQQTQVQQQLDMIATAQKNGTLTEEQASEARAKVFGVNPPAGAEEKKVPGSSFGGVDARTGKPWADAFGNPVNPKMLYTYGKDRKLYPEAPAAPPKLTGELGSRVEAEEIIANKESSPAERKAATGYLRHQNDIARGIEERIDAALAKAKTVNPKVKAKIDADHTKASVAQTAKYAASKKAILTNPNLTGSPGDSTSSRGRAMAEARRDHDQATKMIEMGYLKQVEYATNGDFDAQAAYEQRYPVSGNPPNNKQDDKQAKTSGPAPIDPGLKEFKSQKTGKTFRVGQHVRHGSVDQVIKGFAADGTVYFEE